MTSANFSLGVLLKGPSTETSVASLWDDLKVMTSSGAGLNNGTLGH